MKIEISAFGYELYLGPHRNSPLEGLLPTIVAAIPFLISRSGASVSTSKEDEEDDVPPLNETLEQIAAERLDALEDKVSDLNSYTRERYDELRRLEIRAREMITKVDLDPLLTRFTALTDRVGSLEQKLRDLLVTPRINHTSKSES